MRNKLLCFFVMFLFTSCLKAQKCKKNIFNPAIQISFAPSGKLIEFPPAVITLEKHVHFSVKMPMEDILAQQRLMANMLTEASEFLKKHARDYKCLFDEELKNDTTTFDAISKILKDSNFCLGSSINDKALATELAPVHSYLRKVLDSQFQIKIYNESTCIKTIPLRVVDFKCKSCCVEFESVCEELEDLLCEECIPQRLEELSFQLIRRNPMASTVVEWYNQQSAVLNKKEEATKDYIQTALKNFSDPKDCDAYKNGLTAVNFLKDWFNKWFWFTGGNLTLDPLDNLPKAQQGKIKDQIAQLSKEIDDLKEKKRFNDSIKVKLKARPWLTKAFSREVERGGELRDQIEAKTKEKTQLQEKLDNGIQHAKSLVDAVSVLYFGKLALSDKSFAHYVTGNGFINLQKQFDASRSYKPIYKNYRQQKRLNEIPENEKVKVIIHNLDTVRTVKLDEKILDFDDVEEFTKLVREQLGKIDFSSVTKEIFNNTYDFFQSLEKSGISLKSLDSLAEKCECQFLQGQLVALYENNEKGNILFPPGNILISEPTATTRPIFRTDMFSVKDIDAPFKDSILFKEAIKNDTTQIGKTVVKFGKLRFIQIAAGFAFTRNPVTLTSIDTTGGGFKVSTKDNEFAAIVGFKVYPFKNYNRDNNIIPRYPLRRLSAFGGFEIIHPLKNFYVGGAYDIVPGLAINYGWNYYQRTNYQVQNNQITNTSRTFQKSGPYYAVMVNPTILVQVLKQFFTQL